MEIDHLVIAATDLADGTAVLEERLGLALSPGGEHVAMGTHNRLLGLGPVYLEVIAINPDARGPDHPRWYALDSFSGETRLTHWAARGADLSAMLKAAPAGTGDPKDVTRGDLTWQMAIPETGQLPFDGMFPALLQWHGTAHPCQRLEEKGCKLRALEVAHPDADGLTNALQKLADPLPVVVQTGPVALRAEIETPHGLREITG